MNALLLLLAATSVLVLHSGDRIVIEGGIREERGVVKFRSEGLLYSLPASEIARVESVPEAPPPRAEEASTPPPRRLRVSEEERQRLLAELQNNHAGTPAPRGQGLENTTPPPTPGEKAAQKREEREWRSQARMYDENVRRAAEEVELLERRADELRSKISSLIASGYKPRDFTYDTTRLARTEEQLPYARLELARAERARDQFLDDARREGVLPGWLR